ncbi:hypothetical protein ACXR2U_03500 [Jatrophihabitans sp. YIM 134969]
MALVAVVLVPAALAGCASAPVSTPTARAAATSAAPTAAGNRAAAQAAADRLATGAVLPPGAVAVDRPPEGLSGPVTGIPLSTQLIDTVRYASVPMTMSEATAWFDAHPQGGLLANGTGSTGSLSGPTTSGFAYAPPGPPPDWGTATLDISLAADGSTTALRIDGIAQWVDPTPVRDTAGGPALRVSVADGCPVSDRGFLDVVNLDAPDLDDRLLPTAAPTGGLRCSYDGGNGSPPSALSQTSALDASQAASAATELSRIPLGSRGSGPRNCPMDDGRATVWVFSYAGRADVDVWQRTSGCGGATNGHIVASGF